MIVANTRAMRAAIDLADQVSGDAILAIHEALMHDSEPAIAGKWRTEQGWIGGGNFGPRGADFIAPQQDRIPCAIDDLIRFAKRSDIAVLAHIAIAQAQFETIHPFPDGNGRTGRALIQSMLRNKRLTRQVTVPVSAGLLIDTSSYFQALTAYREGDPAPIVQRLSEASMLAVVNAQLVSDQLNIAINNVYRYVDPLVESKIIVEFTDQARNRAWRAPDVLDALDAFAERAGRRAPLA